MSSMSKCAGPHQRAAFNDQSKKAERTLKGQRLSDVLTVINKREFFNRQIRRLVFNLWRRHCWSVGYRRHQLAQAIMDPSMAGVVIEADSPDNVARRLLGWATP